MIRMALAAIAVLFVAAGAGAQLAAGLRLAINVTDVAAAA